MAEMLALVDLQAAANRAIGGYSGGMVQRLGAGQALLHRPPVLFWMSQPMPWTRPGVMRCWR